MIKKLSLLKSCKIKVLVTDDKESNAQYLNGILSLSGYDVVNASSGTACISIAKRQQPDVVLVDMNIQDISVFDIARRLRDDEKTKNIPVIFITYNRDTDELVKCFEAGAADYVVKPFVKDELLARVKAHAELSRQRRHEDILTNMLDKYALELILDMQGKIVYASSAFLSLGKYQEEDITGESFNILKHPDSFRCMLPDILDSVRNKFLYYKEIDLKKSTGEKLIVNVYAEPITIANGEVVGALCFMTDITSRKELEVLSVTDRLTGLNNRQKLDQIINYEFSQFQRYNTPFSVILMDLDNFKFVNDTYGHIMGDKVLKSLADILKINVREADTAGR